MDYDSFTILYENHYYDWMSNLLKLLPRKSSSVAAHNFLDVFSHDEKAIFGPLEVPSLWRLLFGLCRRREKNREEKIEIRETS